MENFQKPSLSLSRRVLAPQPRFPIAVGNEALFPPSPQWAQMTPSSSSQSMQKSAEAQQEFEAWTRTWGVDQTLSLYLLTGCARGVRLRRCGLQDGVMEGPCRLVGRLRLRALHLLEQLAFLCPTRLSESSQGETLLRSKLSASFPVNLKVCCCWAF